MSEAPTPEEQRVAETWLEPAPVERDQAQLSALASFFADALKAETSVPAALANALGDLTMPAYVVLRAGGRKIAEAWAEGPTGRASALEAAVGHLRESVDEGARQRVDAVELCFAHHFRAMDMRNAGDRRAAAANVHRGVRGLLLAHENHVEMVAPTWTVAQNRNLDKSIGLFRESRRLTQADFQNPDKVRVLTFEASQFLLDLSGHSFSPDEGKPGGVPMFRGNRLVDVSEVNRAFVQRLERDLGDFLLRSVQKDGRMLYMWYPSRQEEALKRNNMIRQWMATVALARTGTFREDKRFHKAAEENIRYNLRKFYHPAGKLGCIEYNGKVKLGSVALAVLSMVEHPRRKQFKRVEQKLWAMIDHLWQESGEFRTFFKPADRNDVQNFYPGEAQLAWAFHFDETRDEKLLDKFMRSFRYYRQWHLDNRNPAFIPWHAQAYYKVWKITKDDELRDFIFESNDWLLSMQQWDGILYPDAAGRFHDPKRPQYGPPHSSSTGVYMEGLIDAFELARELGETERQESYRLAMVRGLRSVMQVMYKDDIDMYYVPNRDFLRGGVRTTVYDNIVRVDNVQHNQMAIMKILRAFTDEDFLHPPVD